MNNRYFLIAFIVLISVLLAGCGYFDKTYVVETDYPLGSKTDTEPNDTLSVTNFATLREGIRRAVANGLSARTLVFDSSYSGNPAEDLAAACWQVRTEDALCIYCVENISYELKQIVAVTEAKLSITYSPNAIPVSEITRMPYATELNGCIAEAISSGQSKIAVLISRTNLSAEDMVERVSEVYRKNPGLAPAEPAVEVTMFSGSGAQSLYELSMETGLSHQDFLKRKEELDSFVFEFDENADERTKAETAALSLVDACDRDAPGTIYSALIERKASPAGIALAYVDLCKRCGLDCRVIQGQRDWTDHCWNIVRIDGHYYHVDLFAGMNDGFLKTDASFWGSYRWAVNEYPKCNGSDEA